MKKNFTSTLVMFGLLVGLSAWYFLYEQKYRVTQKEAEDSQKKLIALNADEVSEIKLEKLKNPPPENSSTPLSNPQYESIEIKKNGKDWFITSPVQTAADSLAVGALVSAICDAKQERIVEENPKDISAYGLTYPLIKVSVRKDANTAFQEIDLGINTPVAYSVYTKVSNQPSVFKSGRTLKSSVDKDLFALRDKNILTINRQDVKEVEIESTKESLVLSKDLASNKDNWSLSRENIPADSLEWSKTLTSLIELKATKVVSETADRLAELGLSKPLAKITFNLTNQKKQILLLGKSKDSLFAKREGLDTLFEVDKTLEEKVLTPSSQYRDKHLAKFDRYSISKIKLETQKESLELKKTSGDQWKLAADENSLIDSNQIDSLLTRLQDIQLTKYLSDKVKSSSSKPDIKISLFEKLDNTEKEVIQLVLSKGPQNSVKGTRNGLPLSFEISKDDFEKLNFSKQTFLKQEDKNKEAEKPQKKS